jgi:DNA-binding winged helix-turn-helix (wHTH) protein
MLYRFGKCEIDTEKFELRRAGSVVAIEPQVFEILTLLVAHRDRVVTRRELHEQVWRGRVVTDAALNSRIKAARAGIGDDGVTQRAIRTHHRTGYRFVGEVTEIRESRVASPLPPNTSHWLIVGSRRIALGDGENILGRDPAASIWLDYETVSRRHARIVILNGRTELKDLGSKNGTSLGGKPVSDAAILHNGDEFVCGQVSIVYRQFSVALPTATQLRRVGTPG